MALADYAGLMMMMMSTNCGGMGLRVHGYRGWFIHPLSVTHWWLVLAALVPGVLGTILVFLDQQISTAIVNRKEHKLKVRHLLFFVVVCWLGYFEILEIFKDCE